MKFTVDDLYADANSACNEPHPIGRYYHAYPVSAHNHNI